MLVPPHPGMSVVRNAELVSRCLHEPSHTNLPLPSAMEVTNMSWASVVPKTCLHNTKRAREGWRYRFNVLKCRKSGIVIDITLGQFLGTMKPYVFNNTDQFFSQVPGEIIYFHKTKEEDIDEQVSRDNAEFRSRFSKDSKPGRFIN